MFKSLDEYRVDLSASGSTLNIPLESLILTYQQISTTALRITIAAKDTSAPVLTDIRRITIFNTSSVESLRAEVLYETAREYIGDTNEKVVFDLYSGTGTIAQILAPVAKKVVGVEIVEEAVEAAKENAELNNLDNCTFWAGDVLKVIDELGEVPDLIMLDPPRDGVNPKALMKILNFGVERLVYIACKPTSLARDLEMIQGRGYKVEKISGVDLFPGTYHVETICQLVKVEKNI